MPIEFKVPGVEPKGTVTAQKPLPSKKVPRGSKMRINVSTGAGPSSGTTTGSTVTTPAPQTVKVPVPKLLGLQQSTAQRRLHSAGLGSRVRYVSSQRPAGQVVAQSPRPGTSVSKGTKVQISVSLGPNATTTPVPDVAGMITVPPADPSQSGRVVDEQPSAGARARRQARR